MAAVPYRVATASAGFVGLTASSGRALATARRIGGKVYAISRVPFSVTYTSSLSATGPTVADPGSSKSNSTTPVTRLKHSSRATLTANTKSSFTPTG